ncbi:MAG: lamin tail domain-containing protein [Bacteroidota bacterium]
MRYLMSLFLLFIHATTYAQPRYSVLIHEIFADPTPSVGLPNTEWIEIKNCSGHVLNLQGWRLADASGQSSPFPNISLATDSLLLLSYTTGANSLNSYGRCLGLTSFPSLDNEGETIVLKNASGQIIHAVRYSVSWHKTELKKEGGWSLEMIDPKRPGLFAPNWSSSIHPNGGTPGKPNSTAAVLEDREPPQLLNVYSIDSSLLLLCFDEALDSLFVSQEAMYRLSDGREIIEASCLPPLFDRVILRTDWPLLLEKIYTLTLLDLKDLSGNQLPFLQTTRVGVASTPDNSDLCINELLFDPPTGCTDYVELLVTGKKIIDLSRIFLSSRSSSGSLGTIKPICPEPRYAFPGDHLVLSSDAEALKRFYFVKDPDRLIRTDALPSLPDTEGNLSVLNAQGDVVDALAYQNDWHFPLLNNKTGVALERIDPMRPTQDKNNWQSAASTVGYGTPTSQNSQYRVAQTQTSIFLSSILLSPKRDGRDDIIQIGYQHEKGGNRVRIRIFHSSGTHVRELANQTMVGTTALFSWDGSDEQGHALPVGQYILLIEITDIDGRMQRTKKVVAIVDG